MRSLDPRARTGRQVRRMFEGIAPRYDRVNRLLSVGLDQGWRRAAVAAALAGRTGPVRVLDACCGTGDLAVAFRRDGRVGEVVGLDFAAPMLARARRKQPAVHWVAGDALRAPLPAGRFDVVSVAFGLRNLEEPALGVRELARLLRPGGTLAVLEFFRPPPGLLAACFRFYFRRLLPRLGRWLSGQGTGSAAGSETIDAYRYLSESVEAWPGPDQVTAWMEQAGLDDRQVQPLTLGAVSLLTARQRSGSTSRRTEERPLCTGRTP